MKSILLVLLTIFTISLSAQESDLQAVEAVLHDYMDGGTNRDTERLVSAFHPQATMKYLRDGVYKEVNAREFFGKGKSGGPKIERTTQILSVDLAGHVAMAKLQLRYEDDQFIDYMTLMKIDGQWSIINKAFYVDKFNE